MNTIDTSNSGTTGMTMMKVYPDDSIIATNHSVLSVNNSAANMAASGGLSSQNQAAAIFYHIVDHFFGVKGSNNSHIYSYTSNGATNVYNLSVGPPHSFPLFMGSNEAAPSIWRRVGWTLEDTLFVLFCALLLYGIRRILNSESVKGMIFKLRDYSVGSSAADGNKEKKEAVDASKQLKDEQRLMENLWFSLYYIASAVLGFLILKETPWFWDLSHLVIGYPQEQTGYEISPFVRMYLLVGAGFYFQALFTLLFVDERMKDFVEMLVHHLVTIVLIVWCVISYYHRIGTLVLLLHDVVDVFLYSAKTLKLFKQEKICEMLFVGFVVSFLILRLVYLPYLIINALFFVTNSWDYPQRYYIFRYVENANSLLEVTNYGGCLFKYCISSFWSLISLLVVLVSLHIFWFSMIMKIIINKVRGKELNDIREDDE
ncbi:predicted protein [Naegleria gruberi]|uniref:Predicted protein n=1 Tax=Naegleria gruberi TaxID=5762 RepID=D2VYY0_NAEGR|nr:uncharacterized protein NAEGRDRAFT_81765 [Naegleria gruberi]EFC38033.1 predicted protein [Naegleria gruberi]|eukprot:XP_002670777.1 predicted protein [Naegleria gruberi strain NEG-M]